MAFRALAETITLAGQITEVKPEGAFTLRCRSGDIVDVLISRTTGFEVLTNVDAVPRDRTAEPEPQPAPASPRVSRYLAPGTLVFVRGIHQEDGERERFEARTVYVLQSRPGGKYVFEETHWWLAQICRLADRWLDELFDARREYTVGDYAQFYRTNLSITGGPGGSDPDLQECATLSRLIYGLSSAYLLTGSERYFLAARAAVAHQRQAFRSLTSDGAHCFWAFGRRRSPDGERLLFASDAADDRGTVPLYEQIYALAGLAQYYRITADWEVLQDIRLTLNTFDDFFLDDAEAVERGFPGAGGYFSHVDYVTMRPDTPALGENRLRKNWNSIGDHIPAYLVNLVLALDPVPHGTGMAGFEEFRDRVVGMLDRLTDLIVEKFPDPDSDYVNERFLADWTPDHDYKWQLDRGIVGHNLKIAWNLTRCAFNLQTRAHRLRDHGEPERAQHLQERATTCLDTAARLADRMAEVGVDRLRGGIYDAVERHPSNGMPVEFAWGPTKDFWQQEQAVLAYLALYGATGREDYLGLARECIAFWNLFFLDRDRQGIYFRTTEGGVPVIEGIYGQKGGHAISGYHAFELNYLAHLYLRAHVERDEQDRGFCLYFHLLSNREQESVNVLPDFMPPGRVEIRRVTVNGLDRTKELRPEGADDFQIRISGAPADPIDGSINLAVEFAVHGEP